MKNYHSFIGIDIGKFNFVVSTYGLKETKEFDNSAEEGIIKFFDYYGSTLNESLCILETTGGYEADLLMTLCNKNISVHRANTRKVKILYVHLVMKQKQIF